MLKAKQAQHRHEVVAQPSCGNSCSTADSMTHRQRRDRKQHDRSSLQRPKYLVRGSSAESPIGAGSVGGALLAATVGTEKLDRSAKPAYDVQLRSESADHRATAVPTPGELAESGRVESTTRPPYAVESRAAHQKQRPHKVPVEPELAIVVLPTPPAANDIASDAAAANHEELSPAWAAFVDWLIDRALEARG